jgi:hypothetical protein
VDANEEYRATVLESHPNLKDGILLLKVWLRQRGLDQVSSLSLLFLFWVVLIDSMWLVGWFVVSALISLCCNEDMNFIEIICAT